MPNTATFNKPGERFGSNVVPRVRRFLQRIDNPDDVRQAPAADVSDGRIKRQMGFVSTEQTATVVEPPLKPNRQLGGLHSLVRAAQVAHQHRIGLWDAGMLPAYVGFTSAPEVPAATIESQHNDLLLFSYVPADLLPTTQDFGAMSSPPLRARWVSVTQAKAGITTSTIDSPVTPPTDPTTTTTADEIPSPAPFAESAQGACNAAQSYFQRDSTTLGYTAEQYRVATNTRSINGALV